MEKFPVWLPDSRRLIWGVENRIFIADADKKKLVNST